MSKGPDLVSAFGFQDEQADFKRRHGLFLDRFTNLQQAVEAAFGRRLAAASQLDRIVFFLGRVCVEDFYELLLLSSNGYGIGAMKVLRGMFERVVDACYLGSHRGEAEAFLEFEWVARRKLALAIEETLGPGSLPAEQVREGASQFERVRHLFEIPDCRKCGTKRLNHTWSRLDLVSRAKAAGLGNLVVADYYWPLRYVHSTVGAIVDRIEQVGDGKIAFNPDSQRKHADSALLYAHGLLLRVLRLQKEHFDLTDLGGPLAAAEEDFGEIWKAAT